MDVEHIKTHSRFRGLGMQVCGYPSKEQEQVHKLCLKKKYVAVESFCGAGGMTLGLEWAGFQVRLAFDLDKMAVKSHNDNLNSKCIVADAREITGREIRQNTGCAGDIALFTGGPPCQGFSKQKRGAHLGDERNDLILEYLRILTEIEPRFFIFENVAIFGQKRGRKYVQEMFKRLCNYRLYPHFYNSADYGLPQTRERFVLVGKRKDQNASFHIPKPTCSSWRTVGDVLKGLPEPPQDYKDHPSFPNHQLARVTQPNIERFSHVPQGGGWQDIPNHLRLDCHKDADTKSGGWPDVYGRLEWDGQCPTITGGFDSFTRGRYGHPLQNRPITPREAARIQGFPDDFVFAGTRGDVRRQIGNAVPPPLAEAVGLEILRSMLCSDGVLEDSVCEDEQENGFQMDLLTDRDLSIIPASGISGLS